ncbi:MAG: exodeoxyribonuclease VII large subunit [Thermoleophilia bacterium]|nr:exodeoxyribonuclease VII large subunit [Thermoleophilia bacterium]
MTGALARRLEDIPSLWVEAEVHNLRGQRGQVYFTLRDEHQVDASMNAVVFDRLPAPPRDGSLVHAYGRVEFWAERTQLRMRVERIELAGEGLLVAQMEALRAVLDREGLLAEGRKRRLPLLPRRVGLVTSATGAARDDVLRNLWERFPDGDVVLVDVPVQGDAAAPAIVRALRRLAEIPDVDVVIVTRGGGALEDLMAFNSEEVCRAVAACRAPVVSAVGHERDVTLCDLVADLRVSTPTAAARAVVPDARELAGRLEALELGLIRGLVRARGQAEARLEQRSPGLAAALRAVGTRAESRVATAGDRLAPALARHAERAAAGVHGHEDRMRRAVAVHAREAGVRLSAAAAMLDALGPQRTLARGYAIVRDAATTRPLVDAAALTAGGDVTIQMRDGSAQARITEVQG